MTLKKQYITKKEINTKEIIWKWGSWIIKETGNRLYRDENGYFIKVKNK